MVVVQWQLYTNRKRLPHPCPSDMSVTLPQDVKQYCFTQYAFLVQRCFAVNGTEKIVPVLSANLSFSVSHMH